MIFKNQKGVSLVIIFLIMTIIIAVVLGITTIVVDQIKSVGSMENASVAQSAAYDGIEKVFYYDDQVPAKASRGICNIGIKCPTDASDPNGDFATHCNNLTLTETTSGGCDPVNCNGCVISFDSTYSDGQKNTVTATVSCSNDSTNLSILSTGTYKGIEKQMLVDNNPNSSTPQTCLITN